MRIGMDDREEEEKNKERINFDPLRWIEENKKL